jgi:hypothetical protein
LGGADFPARTRVSRLGRVIGGHFSFHLPTDSTIGSV